MANYFDQFDSAPAEAPKAAAAPSNFFDQFDGPAAAAKAPEETPQSTKTMPGILEAGAQGFGHAISGYKKTAGLAAGVEPQTEEPSPAAAPLEWKDALSPIGKLAPKLAYGLAEGSPVMAGGLTGAGLGSLVSPVAGTIVGGMGGAALAEGAKTLGPVYAEELKKSPTDKEGAWTRAMQSAATSGAFSGASWGLFPVGSKALEPLKHLLFQTVGVQPGVSMAHQAVSNVQNDKPITENLGQSYAQGVVGTAIPAFGHAAVKAAIGRGASPGGDDPPPPNPIKAKIDGWMDGTLGEIVNDAQMKLTPMAARSGSDAARAIARDFADEKRASRWQWARVDTTIKKNLSEEQQAKIWKAGDEESVIHQMGDADFVAQQHAEGRGLAQLTPQERSIFDALHEESRAAWDSAVDAGIVEGSGKDFYTPRTFLKAAVGSDGPPNSLTKIGTNLRTSSPNTKHRKYLFAEETEAAGKKILGEDAELVRNIRALPLASARLRDAVAGRNLINKVKEVGARVGEETVVEGAVPSSSPYKWFTIDHPAFTTWKPKLEVNKETGRSAAVKDENGNVIFEKKPLYVRSDFEGPLRSVLTRDQGKIYNGLMELKAKAMSVIMYSPILHNIVEWGRAFPAMPGKVATFKIYFEGDKAIKDTAFMQNAVQNGLVPIGGRAGKQDITSMMEEPTLGPRKSITSEVVAAIPDLFSKTAGDAVRRKIASLGDFWHNTLLWDQVAKLQMGLYKNFRESMMSKGIDEQTASRAAAHLANRYAGALPAEAMSENARKFANLTLFSRTFTLGNIGAMKDMFVGLPRDVKAQILRDAGPEALGKIKSYAQRKAVATIALDLGLMYVGNSILQDTFDRMRGDKSLGEIGNNYIERMSHLLKRTKEHPFEVLAHPFEALEGLSATAYNEPGKQDRVLVGYQQDGTAIYMRNPTGKIGEEVLGWATSPFDMVKRKLGTVARPLWQLAANDIGFGRKLYDPNPKSTMDVIKNAGNIASAFMSSQVPASQFDAAGELARGEGEAKTNTLKLLGPFAGLTFSKGAPGGPAAGELYKFEEKQRYLLAQALPEIRKQIQRGNTEAAVAKMNEIGVPRALQNYYIKTTINPQSRISNRKVQNFMTGSSEEEKERFFRLLNSNKGP